MRPSTPSFGENGAMSMSGDPEQRVGNSERDAAIAALNQHWQAGRLDPAEHERRTTAAYAAVTRGTSTRCSPTFRAVTRPPGDRCRRPAAGRGRGVAVPAREIAPQSGTGLFPSGSWVAEHRDALMGITPFVALALFFATRWWPWFLLIPAAGIVLYSGNDGRKRRRDGDG